MQTVTPCSSDMAIKIGIIFSTLIICSIAASAIEDNEEADLSIFFVNSDESPDQRIVGGAVAAEGAHPWMAAFTVGGTVRALHCGASIISARTVLTAAHCIVPVRRGDSVSPTVRVNVGTNRFNSGGQSLTVEGMAIHPHYNRYIIKNDIGTLFTSSAIVFDSLTRAIPLAFDEVGGGIQTRAAGWGRTRVNAPASQRLLDIQLPTIDGNQCIRGVRRASRDLNMRAPPIDPRVEICTFHSRGRGTCRGDSGSALVRIGDNQQIGIVSWGFPCARGAPDVYARVSAFQTWIGQNTRV